MLVELNRLQSNFPYDSELFQMCFSCTNNNSNADNSLMIGFVDVDCRPSKRKMCLHDYIFKIWFCMKNVTGKVQDMAIDKLLLSKEIKNCLGLRVEHDN